MRFPVYRWHIPHRGYAEGIIMIKPLLFVAVMAGVVYTMPAAQADSLTLSLPGVQLHIGDRDRRGYYWDGRYWRDPDYWRERHYYRRPPPPPRYYYEPPPQVIVVQPPPRAYREDRRYRGPDRDWDRDRGPHHPRDDDRHR
ncbi:DUF2502 domain-containing protein [Lonsdalea populi]|nr:DUF2502 domain-containing protein [Lonsdalea populi]